LPEAQRYKQESLVITFQVYEPNIRSDNYADPISYGIRNMFHIKPAKDSLRFKDRVYVKQTTLQTDTGMFIESIETEKIVTLDGFDRTTAQMTLDNVPNNVVDTGELIMVDY
jgi:hypothetical protein